EGRRTCGMCRPRSWGGGALKGVVAQKGNLGCQHYCASATHDEKSWDDRDLERAVHEKKAGVGGVASAGSLGFSSRKIISRQRLTPGLRCGAGRARRVIGRVFMGVGGNARQGGRESSCACVDMRCGRD
ncbi:MAG TPA: hypothetical protein VJA21_31140, partial [Verrucomicrobiae bacterium]